MTGQRIHRVAVLPGDGIGLEVVPPAMRCIDVLAEHHGFAMQWDTYDWVRIISGRTVG